jgi:hypothetical protein
VFRTYLFTDEPITELEHEETADADAGDQQPGLGLGNLAGSHRR